MPCSYCGEPGRTFRVLCGPSVGSASIMRAHRQNGYSSSHSFSRGFRRLGIEVQKVFSSGLSPSLRCPPMAFSVYNKEGDRTWLSLLFPCGPSSIGLVSHPCDPTLLSISSFKALSPNIVILELGPQLIHLRKENSFYKSNFKPL